MKHKSLYTVLTLVLFAMLLAGCVDIREEIWVNADNTGQVKLQVGVSEALITAASALDSTVGTTLDPRATADKDFAANQFVQNYTYQDSTDGTTHFYTTSFDVTDLKAFLGTTQNDLLKIQLSELANGNLGYSQTLAYNTGLEEFTSSSEVLTRAYEAIKASAMKKTTWQVTLHLPNVVTTNGTLSEETKAIVWSYPMSTVASANPPIQLTAEYKKPLIPTSISKAAWFPWALGGAGVVLVGIIATIVITALARRNRPQPPSSGGDYDFSSPNDFSS